MHCEICEMGLINPANLFLSENCQACVIANNIVCIVDVFNYGDVDIMSIIFM